MIRYYILYFILLYLTLPFNWVIDFIAIFGFFIIFNEDEHFALIYLFFSGLLLDLYNPSALGKNTLIYTLLAQGLIYTKKYISHNLITTLAAFTVFFALKTLLIQLTHPGYFTILQIILTEILFIPAFLILNRIKYGIWMKS